MLEQSKQPSARNGPNTATDILVGIPAYNEEIAIGSVIHKCQAYSDEVVVVDDGSTDDTVEIAEAAGATVLEHGTNQGKGKAVRTLLNHAQKEDPEALVLIDGDGQHLPRDIPAIVQPVVEGDSDIVIGSRYLEDDTETPVYRRLGQRVLDTITFGSTGTKVTDSQSGFRALAPAAIDRLTIRTDGMGVESEMIGSATEQGLDIEEVPIDVRYEEIDGQTFNPLRHGLSVVVFLLRLVRDRHPLVFFGLPGIVLAGIGAFYGIDGIMIYRATGEFYPGKMLAAGFATILGVLGVFTGLILNRISNMLSKLDERSK
ncbi:glycosyltransferase family 2 protein [Halosimplex halobium]|uniref:glycosyltransferase family 2 protein n=1 Tax=Halosimplex halobium TaxID=3396618 RepID=UPI003F570A4B